MNTKTSSPELLADRLLALRLSNKLTRQQMADKLGLSPGAYRTYEAGKKHPVKAEMANLEKKIASLG